jgi:methanogenic corrinoid protein MtbC1
MSEGPANVSHMGTRDVMDQLHAAIAALGEEDVRDLPEATLTEQIDQLVAILHQLDAHLSRVANAVLARTFTISEVVAA